MSDGSATPHEPVIPPLPPEPVVPPTPNDPLIPDAVVPPPAAPGAVASPPPAVVPADAVVPPPAPTQEWPEDTAAPSAPEATASGGYRFLTVGIFAFLLLLLGGAIAMLFYLAANTSFSFPTTDPDPSPEPVVILPVETPAAVEPSTDPQAPAPPLTADSCSAFCADLANQAGVTVVGADGGSVWQLATSWATAELATLPSEEVVGAAYESDAGRVEIIVWRFGDDETAQEGFDVLADALGAPTDSGEVLGDGRGMQNTYSGSSLRTILWTVLGDESRPWVMEVIGPDDDAVQQFYYALPF